MVRFESVLPSSVFILPLKSKFAESIQNGRMAESAASPPKPVHTIVLDAGPIIKNTPPLSTLLAQCDEIITTPAVVSEIRDPDARARVEALYLPFMKQRAPTPHSFSVISEFARKTGDRSVLSRNDIEVLALAYEIECERNGGDWRLRSVPGQKRVNGKPPVKVEEPKEEDSTDVEPSTEGVKEATATEGTEEPKPEEAIVVQDAETETNAEDVAESVTNASNDIPTENDTPEDEQGDVDVDVDVDEDDAADSDGGEWITPTNYKKRLARDEAGGAADTTTEPKIMQVATMTTDFAVSMMRYAPRLR
jgi:RNA-binding protein NOB1